jgi:hypothetical protein
MREILFKAKTLGDEPIGEPVWVEGYYTKTDAYGVTGYTPSVPIIADEDGAWVEINPETLCEYTGIKDKSGVKIFEGDIVRCTYYGDIRSNRVVVFINGEYLLESKGEYVSIALYEKEVIGNIYDNPELLEEK